MSLEQYQYNTGLRFVDMDGFGFKDYDRGLKWCAPPSFFLQ